MASNLTYTTLLDLHHRLFARFTKYNIHLRAVTDTRTVACYGTGGLPTIAYIRPSDEASTVERMMGRDIVNEPINLRLHPVIELRADDNGLSLELLVTPEAWWDQQNLLGKLGIERHRHHFRSIISRLGENYRLGFWEGTHLDDMHLSAKQLSYSGVFDQWMATYSEGQDWFRTGVWYANEEITDSLPNELFQHAQELYKVYNYISWTGNNDYRAFYQRGSRPAYV
jgi:hypothetical protein